MKRFKSCFKEIILSLLFLALFIPLNSCSDKEPDFTIESANPKSVTLIYAVASNNLAYNLYLDSREMLAVAPQLNLRDNVVLLYSVGEDNQCRLQKLRIDDQKKGYFEIVKNYPETPLSVTPERISEVIGDVENLYPEASKGLVLWSHATAWIPWFPPMSQNAKRKTFGLDYFEGVGYQCNITDLARAIPENTFDYIWFDCCYMGNIETIYQLRDKAPRIVGYPTEIHVNGMPYHKTLPFLATETPDLSSAAYALFEYYNAEKTTVSVSIVDTSGLENLAAACRPFYRANTPPLSLTKINDYSRLREYPLYDLQQLLFGYSSIDPQDIERLKDAVSSVIELSLVSDYSFDGFNYPFNHTDESGISVNNFKNRETAADYFYKTLDWYKDTRE